MNWIKYQIHTTTDAADNIGGILYELGISGYEINDNVPLTAEEEKQMYTDIPADMGEDCGLSTLTFYTQTPDNDEKEFYSTGSSLRDETLENNDIFLKPDELIDTIKDNILELQKFIPISMPEFEYTIVNDVQWKDKWKESFKPFRVADDIIIKPTWENIPDDAKETDIIIEIDPGSAFGTGTHETTKLCLKSLRNYITPDTTILDAGCGSGILAISALLCGASHAFCLDIDKSAVEAAKENAVINHILSDKIQIYHANILEDAEIIKENYGGPVDIVVANILADVIILLSDCIRQYIKKDGLFISSGILAEKSDEVETALIKNNFKILEKNILGEWVSFVAKA